jgi:hypothetical protein
VNNQTNKSAQNESGEREKATENWETQREKASLELDNKKAREHTKTHLTREL